MAFRDHHRIRAPTIAARDRDAARTARRRRIVLTTEKDLVRLLPFRPFAAAGRVRAARRRNRRLETLDVCRCAAAIAAARADDRQAGAACDEARVHRLEYGAVMAGVGCAVRLLPMRCGARPARCSDVRSTRSIDRPPAAGAAQPARRRFPRAPKRSAHAIARDMFAHFGRLLTVLLKFSTMAPGADARARRVRGGGAGPRGARARPRRAAVHRALRLLGNQRARARARAAADGGAGAAARQSAAARSARVGPRGARATR